MNVAESMRAMTLSVGRQTWNFARHFLEMCLSMCLVGTPIVILLTRVWTPDVEPVLMLLAVAAIYTAPMVAWMRFRGMPWQPVLEMGVASFAIAPAVVVLSMLGLVPASTVAELASPSFCGPACVVMFLAMLPRLDLYTGRTGHHH